MSDSKSFFIKSHFRKWHKDISKVETLLNSEEYFLEAIILLSCYVSAFARLRFPNVSSDYKSFKNITIQYSNHEEIFNEIDLLFFLQWKKSSLCDSHVYKKLKDYEKLQEIISAHYGAEENIQHSEMRYQKREALINFIRSENTDWFNEENFLENIELFSNNQIFYEFVRCEAVHNAYFPLFNEVSSANGHRFEDNHHVNRTLILSALKNIASNLENECMNRGLWPHEL